MSKRKVASLSAHVKNGLTLSFLIPICGQGTLQDLERFLRRLSELHEEQDLLQGELEEKVEEVGSATRTTQAAESDCLKAQNTLNRYMEASVICI